MQEHHHKKTARLRKLQSGEAKQPALPGPWSPAVDELHHQIERPRTRASCRRIEMCEMYPAEQSDHACIGERSYEVHYRDRWRSLVRKSFAR
jgi:hypothetical protein